MTYNNPYDPIRGAPGGTRPATGFPGRQQPFRASFAAPERQSSVS
jgi:hypothetical protein